MASDAKSPGTPTWMHAYFEAWNSHDPAKVLACLTGDAVLDDKATGERFEGADRVRELAVRMVEQMSSDYRFDLGELILATDEMFVAEWTMSGTNDRENKVRGLPNTGRPFRVPGVSVGRLRDGKVAEEHMYWNMAAYLSQVGLMPQAPAPATV